MKNKKFLLMSAIMLSAFVYGSLVGAAAYQDRLGETPNSIEQTEADFERWYYSAPWRIFGVEEHQLQRGSFEIEEEEVDRYGNKETKKVQVNVPKYIYKKMLKLELKYHPDKTTDLSDKDKVRAVNIRRAVRDAYDLIAGEDVNIKNVAIDPEDEALLQEVGLRSIDPNINVEELKNRFIQRRVQEHNDKIGRLRSEAQGLTAAESEKLAAESGKLAADEWNHLVGLTKKKSKFEGEFGKKFEPYNPADIKAAIGVIGRTPSWIFTKPTGDPKIIAMKLQGPYIALLDNYGDLFIKNVSDIKNIVCSVKDKEIVAIEFDEKNNNIFCLAHDGSLYYVDIEETNLEKQQKRLATTTLQKIKFFKMVSDRDSFPIVMLAILTDGTLIRYSKDIGDDGKENLRVIYPGPVEHMLLSDTVLIFAIHEYLFVLFKDRLLNFEENILNYELLKLKNYWHQYNFTDEQLKYQYSLLSPEAQHDIFGPQQFRALIATQKCSQPIKFPSLITSIASFDITQNHFIVATESGELYAVGGDDCSSQSTGIRVPIKVPEKIITVGLTRKEIVTVTTTANIQMIDESKITLSFSPKIPLQVLSALLDSLNNVVWLLTDKGTVASINTEDKKRQATEGTKPISKPDRIAELKAALENALKTVQDGLKDIKQEPQSLQNMNIIKTNIIRDSSELIRVLGSFK